MFGRIADIFLGKNIAYYGKRARFLILTKMQWQAVYFIEFGMTIICKSVVYLISNGLMHLINAFQWHFANCGRRVLIRINFLRHSKDDYAPHTFNQLKNIFNKADIFLWLRHLIVRWQGARPRHINLPLQKNMFHVDMPKQKLLLETRNMSDFA